LNELLNHPAVQTGIAPFVAGLVATLVFHRMRLGGLAILAGFATVVALVSGFSFTPLTATRKIVLLALLAPVIGILVDFALKPNAIGRALIALGAAGAALWVFWPVLAQRALVQGLIVGGFIAIFVAWLVASMLRLADEPVRAGAAGLALGIGSGGLAILGASALYGQYGIAMGAAAGAFLLVQMLMGKKITAGATFSLPTALIAGLLGAATMLLAQLRWYTLVVLALVPLAAQLPVPERKPVWLQAIVASFYTLLVVVLAFALAYFMRGSSS